MYDFHDSTDDDTLKFWTEKWVDVFGEKKKTFLYFFVNLRHTVQQDETAHVNSSLKSKDLLLWWP